LLARKFSTYSLCAVSLAFTWSIGPVTGIFIPQHFRKNYSVTALTFSLSVLPSFLFLSLL
jgi:hypothetical protein